MKADNSDFKNMQIELERALAILDKHKVVNIPDENKDVMSSPCLPIDETDSLLSRCQQIVDNSDSRKIVRTVHHFACSGGSVISKCINAMPSVRLLSELHPLARKHLDTKSHKFTPSDIISCAYYADVTDIDELAKKIMVNSVGLSIEHTESRGEILVFREHTHTDFCVGDTALTSRFFQTLDEDSFINLPAVTVRNPIDSFLSLKKNGWVHFSPATFNEYCKRLNAFLSTFSDESIFFYEKFVEKPKVVIKKICEALDIPYSDAFIDIFDARSITGDSGRGSSEITLRPRRELPSEVKYEVENSEEFFSFLERFDFYKGCMENLK